MMMEINIPREKAQRLAQLMDSVEFNEFLWLLDEMLKHNHELMERADEREYLQLQGDCKRLRRLLEFRKFLIQSVKQNGADQAKD